VSAMSAAEPQAETTAAQTEYDLDMAAFDSSDDEKEDEMYTATEIDGKQDDHIEQDSEALLPGWEEELDDDSGETYWWHRPSGETTWTKPLARAFAGGTVDHEKDLELLWDAVKISESAKHRHSDAQIRAAKKLGNAHHEDREETVVNPVLDQTELHQHIVSIDGQSKRKMKKPTAASSNQNSQFLPLSWRQVACPNEGSENIASGRSKDNHAIVISAAAAVAAAEDDEGLQAMRYAAGAKAAGGARSVIDALRPVRRPHSSGTLNHRAEQQDKHQRRNDDYGYSSISSAPASTASLSRPLSGSSYPHSGGASPSSAAILPVQDDQIQQKAISSTQEVLLNARLLVQQVNRRGIVNQQLHQQSPQKKNLNVCGDDNVRGVEGGRPKRQHRENKREKRHSTKYAKKKADGMMDASSAASAKGTLKKKSHTQRPDHGCPASASPLKARGLQTTDF